MLMPDGNAWVVWWAGGPKSFDGCNGHSHTLGVKKEARYKIGLRMQTRKVLCIARLWDLTLKTYWKNIAYFITILKQTMYTFHPVEL
jgi:hypothetical protein